MKKKIAEIKKILCGTCCAFGWEDCRHFDNDTYCLNPQLKAILALIEQPKKPATLRFCNEGHTIPLEEDSELCRGACPDYYPDDNGKCVHLHLEEELEPHIKCLFFKNGKCIEPLDPTAECKNCGKPAGTCALTCDCEEETCNIGSIAEPAEMPLIKADSKFETSRFYHGATLQRDAVMAWLPAHDAEVRREFAEKVDELIKVAHDDITDDECIEAILVAHNAELERIAAGMESLKEPTGFETFKVAERVHGIEMCQDFVKAQKEGM
ncbi:hypothetical protein M0R72_13245 [Candidatus Pacearchaeota archaeon]|jgi:hypothetical protein|nr:hypothetical protein [Candidatus Pacearchaeota archaeon]